MDPRASTAGTANDPLAAFRLDGEVAVVTGGGNGIGRTVAIALAGVGASVAILDRDGPAAAAVAEAIGGSARCHVADVTDEAAVERVFRRIVDEWGRLDVLVNNAGIAIRRPATELTLEEWNRVLAVNATGVFICARHAARLMLRRGGGRIVNMASVMGLSGGLYPNVAYQTAKGAVVNMTRALAIEWARDNIRVNAVAPGWVRTGLTAALFEDGGRVGEIERATPMGLIAEPEHVVGAVLFLASRASELVTGHILPVDGGFLAR